MNNKTTRILVVDDNPAILEIFSELLRIEGYEVWEAPNGTQALEITRARHPDLLLLDVQMPGLSGPELQNYLSKLSSTLPIVFLTGHADIRTTVQTIKAGADDFLTKPVSSEDLLNAIERALARHEAACDRRNALDVTRGRIAAFTPRERQVFELIVRGKINKQIAHELGTTERTIKAHRQQVMEKAKVQSLAELVSIAEQLGILASAAKAGDGG